MSMHPCELDHLVVTSPTLAAGVKWVEETLGVMAQTGGDHPRMGTHNALLRLGDQTYLEVIAPNPTALTPDRPRYQPASRCWDFQWYEMAIFLGLAVILVEFRFWWVRRRLT